MPDDIDKLLQGEDETTSSTSQVGTNTQGTDLLESEGGKRQQTPEEVEFNSLKGGAQDRFRKMLQRARDAEERLASVQSQSSSYIPPAPQYNPDVRDAVSKLSAVGITTDEKLDQKLKEISSVWQYNQEINRLESSYSGEDGRPKFDRMEYEDYVSRHPEYRGYLPEDVYQKMYREELRDWESQGGRTTSRSKTLRPTRTTIQNSSTTAEEFENILSSIKDPTERRKYYEKNFDKINKAKAEMTPSE